MISKYFFKISTSIFHGNKLGIGLLAAAVFEEYPLSYVSSDTIWSDLNRLHKRRGPSLTSRSIGGSSATLDNALIGADLSLESKLAVGAGEHVDQKLVKADGLKNPVLAEVIQLRYLPKEKLEKLVSKHSDAFPGDRNEQFINLSGVPRVHSVPVQEWRFM